MTSHFEATRQFEPAPDRLFDKCAAVLGAGQYKIESVDRAANRLVAEAGVSWKSWGERIEVTLTADGTAVTVRSTSKLSSTLLDYGRNRQNVEAILLALDAEIARERPERGVATTPAASVASAASTAPSAPTASPASPASPGSTASPASTTSLVQPASTASAGDAVAAPMAKPGAATGTTPTPLPSADGAHEGYLSYAWGGESDQVADRLEASLRTRGIALVRDKRVLGYKGDIHAFMERLGQGRCVVALIGDKYLRSQDCMFELMQVAAHADFQDRVFPVVLDDAAIHRPVERLRYVQYWEGEIRDLDEALKGVSSANLTGFRDAIDQYTEIRRTIAELTAILDNMNTLSMQMHSDSDFEALAAAITERLRR